MAYVDTFAFIYKKRINMQNRFFNPPNLYSPPKGMYSLIAKSENTIYISGLLPLDTNEIVIGINDVVVQYRKVWENINIALSYVGCSPTNLIKTTTYIVGKENIQPVRNIRQELNPVPPPVSTLVVVAGLANADCLVEVDAIAIIDRTEDTL